MRTTDLPRFTWSTYDTCYLIQLLRYQFRQEIHIDVYDRYVFGVNLVTVRSHTSIILLR